MNSLSAVIVAAGSSHRFNKDLISSETKQFVSWDEKPLFIHTLEALSVLPIEEYVLVIRPEDETIFHEQLKKFNSIKNIYFTSDYLVNNSVLLRELAMQCG